MTDFDYDRIAAARESLAGRVIRTPAMPLCGSKIAPYIPDNAELFIKLELFQHTGSFKARGSCLGIDWLDDAQRQRGVAGFSGGNFALALAWAAQSAGVPAKVVMSPALELGGKRRRAFLRTSYGCLLYTSPSPRDRQKSRMPSSA